MLEKPYRGLVWHAPKGAAAAGAREGIRRRDSYEEPGEADAPEDEPERAYPDGSIPGECWNMRRAFAHDVPKKREAAAHGAGSDAGWHP